MIKPVTNTAASVKQRLLNIAKERNEDFEQVLVRFALERLLYRLAKSAHASTFVLKGALLFRLWFDVQQRPTRDADFLGFGRSEPNHLAEVFRDIANAPPDFEDGLMFDERSVSAEEIRKDGEYPGVRVSMFSYLEKTRIPVQCDIGFGDVITPAAETRTYPTLLDMPSPTLRVYPVESVIAEKLEALVKLGAFNSRMKDFFDLWLLSNRGRGDPQAITDAIRATFQRRGTAIPGTVPAGLTEDFAKEKRDQWSAFLRRSSLEGPDFPTIVAGVKEAYLPLIDKARG